MTATLTKLTRSIANYRNAHNEAQRQAAERFMVRRANELRPDLEATKDRLTKGWAWLDAHPDSPAHDETEAMWLSDLEDYERMEDALANALAIMQGRDDVQERKEAA